MGPFLRDLGRKCDCCFVTLYCQRLWFWWLFLIFLLLGTHLQFHLDEAHGFSGREPTLPYSLDCAHLIPRRLFKVLLINHIRRVQIIGLGVLRLQLLLQFLHFLLKLFLLQLKILLLPFKLLKVLKPFVIVYLLRNHESLEHFNINVRITIWCVELVVEWCVFFAFIYD